jgi:predicted DNA-binding ribbon-helix-helix protein
MVDHARATWRVSIRRACRALPVVRATYHYRSAKRSLPSVVRKRSIVIAGHRTSVSLEEPFWTALKEMASARHVALFELVAEIDRDRQYGNLSSAVRVFVLEHHRNLAEGRTKQP